MRKNRWIFAHTGATRRKIETAKQGPRVMPILIFSIFMYSYI